MRRRYLLSELVVAFTLLMLHGCASPLLPVPGSTAALDTVRDADLSARYPSQVKQPTGRGEAERKPQMPEIYPGKDPQPGDVRRTGATGGNPQRPGVEQASDGYQLTFDNAAISDVAKAILGDTLQVPYIIDPRVQGQVTVATGRAVSKDELLKSFEAALKLSNGALVADSNGGYRIVPTGEAASGDVGRVGSVRPGSVIEAGYGVSIMPLRHTSAESMLRVLEGFLARAGTVKAEQTGNLLLIRGSARERENIVDVIATFDVDWMRGQSAGIFPLTHASPEEMIGELNQVLQNEGGSINANMVRFQPIARLNAVLVLARTAKALQTAATWIKRLDKANTAGRNVYVYQVENGKAVDIAQILNDTFGSSGTAVRRSERADVAPGRDATRLSSPGSDRGSTSQFSDPPTNGAPAQAEATIAQAGNTSATTVTIGTSSTSVNGPNGGGAVGSIDARIIANEANNSLLIHASLADYQKILATLRQIDKPPLQVLINATIAEVTLNDALRYGVQAFLKKGNDRDSIGYHPGPIDLTLQPQFPGLNLIYGNVADPRVVLDALSDITSVKVVSSPSVVVIDNQPAVLKVGDEVPISTQQAQSVENPDAPIINSIRFRETGVILKVTPRVNSNGLVTMDVEQEISQVAGTTEDGVSASLTPTISQRRIASTIAVYSGQTVTLGGLISDQVNSDRKSVPVLNKVPYIGDLVGKTEKEARRTELMVFIRPQVIRNSDDASRVSEELRSTLKTMMFEPPPPDHRHGWAARNGNKD